MAKAARSRRRTVAPVVGDDNVLEQFAAAFERIEGSLFNVKVGIDNIVARLDRVAAMTRAIDLELQLAKERGQEGRRSDPSA